MKGDMEWKSVIVRSIYKILHLERLKREKVLIHGRRINFFRLLVSGIAEKDSKADCGEAVFNLEMRNALLKKVQGNYKGDKLSQNLILDGYIINPRG